MVLRKEIDKRTIAEAMAELWEPLTDEQRQLLTDNIRIRSFCKNEVIFCENEVPQFLMCIISGKVKIYVDGIGGRDQIIRLISRKGFFGYRAAFAGENYCNSAAAFESSVICMIPIDVTMRLIQENARLAIYFIKELSALLGAADKRTVSLTQKHIRGRLAESLISLIDKYGVDEDGSTLNVNLSREDLASMSNMTTSNAIRTLSSFAHEHLIVIDGRKIKIIEEKMLRDISEMG